MTASFTVQLTDAALADLVAIRDWLVAEAGDIAADRLIDAMLNKIDLLESFPARGGYVPELAALGMHQYRQVQVHPYRVMYRIRDDQVIISLIVHGRRDLREVLQQRVLDVRPST